MKSLELLNKLGKIPLFTTSDIKRYLKISENSLRKTIWRYRKNGMLLKLKNGLYTVKGGKEPDSFLLANKLYSPSYISFETALSYYGLIPDTIYIVTCATTKITRNFSSFGREFVYRKIKSEAYDGYKPVNIAGNTVLIAEPEKAFADYLYFVFLKKIKYNDRINIKKLNKSRVEKYIRSYNNRDFSGWRDNAFRNRS